MKTPFGVFEMLRGETPTSAPLRAWTAADLLALEWLASEDPGRLLLVNDSWGALAVAAAHLEPVVWGDSALARKATDTNLRANGRSVLGSRAVPGHQAPPGPFDTIIINVPKPSALLRFQSETLRHLIRTQGTDVRIVAAAMNRHATRAAFAALSELGEPVARRAVRKARLIDVNAEAHDGAGVDAKPRAVSEIDYCTSDGVEVHGAAGVFSSGHLDVGTALLLDEIRELDLATLTGTRTPTCLDLGCGSGVVAATLASRWPSTTWQLLDVSDLACLAAEGTRRANGLSSERLVVRVADGAELVPDATIDLVVTNPPFHQDHAVDEYLTNRMVADTARVLKADGSAVVVAQRHLQFHRVLAGYFDQVETVSGHPSHVVMVARGKKRPGR